MPSGRREATTPPTTKCHRCRPLIYFTCGPQEKKRTSEYPKTFITIMKKVLSFVSFLIPAIALLVSCGPSQEKLLSEIDSLESSVTELALEIDTVTARQLVDLYIQYADRFPDDSLAPVYLFKAGDVLQGICDYDASIQCLTRVIDKYDAFEELPLCYFFIGRVYEQKEDFDAAANAYEDFLERYPDHFLAASTRTILPLIKNGMNDEEQLEFLISNTSDQFIVQDSSNL